MDRVSMITKKNPRSFEGDGNAPCSDCDVSHTDSMCQSSQKCSPPTHSILPYKLKRNNDRKQ
jgi:hypothetical protein